jgi:hypothetical protein
VDSRSSRSFHLTPVGCMGTRDGESKEETLLLKRREGVRRSRRETKSLTEASHNKNIDAIVHHRTSARRRDDIFEPSPVPTKYPHSNVQADSRSCFPTPSKKLKVLMPFSCRSRLSATLLIQAMRAVVIGGASARA